MFPLGLLLFARRPISIITSLSRLVLCDLRFSHLNDQMFLHPVSAAAQWLDEVPMLWCVAISLYTQIELRYGKQGIYLPILLTAHSLFATYMVIWLHTPLM